MEKWKSDEMKVEKRNVGTEFTVLCGAGEASPDSAKLQAKRVGRASKSGEQRPGQLQEGGCELLVMPRTKHF